MNKEQTREAINVLPEFHLEKVAVSPDNGWNIQNNDRAVVQNGMTTSYAYVTIRYKLVQFKEVLEPIIEGIDSFDAEVMHYKGVCVMNLDPDMVEFRDGDTKYGITVVNSVDKSTSIVVKFHVEVNGKPLVFPKKLAGFVKNHTGNGFKITQNYIEMIVKVKDAWKNIVEHFPNQVITSEDVEIVCDNFKLKKEEKEDLKLKVIAGIGETNLWDVVEMRLNYISGRHYTSGVHKQKAMERLCSEIFAYASVAGI